jgi:hypothetical protein
MSEVFTQRADVRTGPGRAAIVASLLMHAALIAAMLGNVVKNSDPLPEYKVYRVDIYSPPPQALGEPEAPAKAQPAIVKPSEAKTVAVEKKAPTVVKPPVKKNVTTGTGKSDVAKGKNPDPKALVGGEGLDVHMAGDEFPYPGYLNNIIIQLNRYFRPSTGGNLVTQVGFEIMRDGSVKNVRVLQKSGNFNFDLDAMSAIEQAGRRGAFGPLPKGWVPDRLAIKFRFEPTGR